MYIRGKFFLFGSLFCVAAMLSCKPSSEVSDDTTDAKLAAACDYIQGCGAGTIGGKNGTVYIVTTLADSIDESEDKPVAGTLRYAVEQGEARVVLFNVAGTIYLKKPLNITRGNITIAGQSAPGDGICIADYPIIIKGVENVILRFLRVRMGDRSREEYDALSVNNCKNVVIDHCSFSWSTDECVSCYGNENFTMQYCFVTESLRSSVHGKGTHGYGGIWGGTNATFHHNLIAHHDSRNPRFDHDYVNHTHRGPVDFVNNVVYNWGGNSAYGGESVNTPRQINFTANYFKPGPATNSKVSARLVNPWTSCDNCTHTLSGTVVPPSLYLADNYMFGSQEVTADNRKGSTTTQGLVSSPFSMSVELKAETAEQAYETVLAKAGCSLKRDAIDERIVGEVRNGTSTCKGSNGSKGGLIDTQADAGGWPDYTGTRQKDTDGDGIPDDWETEHGLNPKSYADSKQQTLVAGYSNLEVYLNAIVSHLY
ncbi:MAG: pectate lyase [Paludibacteraceae bacterium]|nr:pectate lyase [Paludibacteraceae bacterium]